MAPFWFGVLAMAAYMLAVWPILDAHSWNSSFFIIAGDKYVDRHEVAAKIFVRSASEGYDGQFFYRMAVAPFSFQPVAGGIVFDAPAYRSQRFFYPLIAWVASLGQPGSAATAMFLVNLAGIGVVAGSALALVRRLGLPDLTALCIALWPGLLVTLTHDTSEIVAAACLLTALLCRVRRQWAPYLLSGIAATLTRETTAPALAGLAMWDGVSALRGGGWRPAVLGALVLMPVLAWHEALPALWHAAQDEGVLAHDFGPPLIGLVRALSEHWTSMIDTPADGTHDVLAQTSLAAMAVLYAFVVLALIAWPSVIAGGGATGAMAAAFLPGALLLLFLREGDGPFATPTEFCRAFAEFWMLGCLVIAAGRKRAPIALAVVMATIVLMFERVSFGLSAL